MNSGYGRPPETEAERVILAIVSSKESFLREVHEVLDGRVQLEAAWDLNYDQTQRLRTLGSAGHCILVIDFSDARQAMAVVSMVSGRPQVVTIVVNSGSSRDELLALMQAGVRDVLPEFNPLGILQSVTRAAAQLNKVEEVLGDLFAFVPAKPGCGATTVATYATAAVTRQTEEPALLLDFDIRLGIMSFLLKIEGAHTIVDALQQADRFEPSLWGNLVCQRGPLHVLGSGPLDYSQPVPTHRFTTLLDFAVRQYPLVAVDLPGTLEDYECETLLRAKKIFLVCTPDVGALHVAHRKSSWLRDLHVADKVTVVLNRVERRSAFSLSDIERIVQLPVRYLLPDAADAIASAVRDGIALQGAAPLAQQIDRIADDMLEGKQIQKKPNVVRRFVEYFSVSPAREDRGS
jgi:Flp pilus assembly CpaE family ATPase